MVSQLARLQGLVAKYQQPQLNWVVWRNWYLNNLLNYYIAIVSVFFVTDIHKYKYWWKVVFLATVSPVCLHLGASVCPIAYLCVPYCALYICAIVPFCTPTAPSHLST